MRDETLAIHAGYSTDPTTHAVATPIYQTVAYEFDSAQHGADLFNLAVPGNIYSRIMNPTNGMLEERCAQLEGGVAALALASGSAAIHYAVVNVARHGDNIVTIPQLYGGTYTLFAHMLPDLGIDVRFAADDRPESIEKLIDDRTKAVFCESIGNPAGNIVDIEALAAVAHRHGVILIVDNTVATPALLKPIQYGADGIGLYRTEFLYVQSDSIPSVNDHFHAYMDAIKGLDGRPIVIRTLDLGADKFSGTEAVIEERNPFLGLRSLRYCLKNPDVFEDQLRAILKASAFGNLSVMFPLVSGIEELKAAREFLDEVKSRMDEAGEEYDPDLPVGIMIELPSAVMNADALARYSDFFSIGTNDLIQYALAVDRGNEHVAELYRPEHPAVLKLIKMTAESAEKANIPVSLCGEMASSVIYSILLIGLGINSFSLAPPQIIPEVKKLIRSTDYADARELADAVLAAEGAEQAREVLEEGNKKIMESAR